MTDDCSMCHLGLEIRRFINRPLSLQATLLVHVLACSGIYDLLEAFVGQGSV